MGGILARTVGAVEGNEEDGDDREDQPAGFQPRFSAGEPLRAVESAGQELAALAPFRKDLAEQEQD